MNTNVNVSMILLVAAIVCLSIALLVSVGVVTSNWQAWLTGGLLAWALSKIA